MAGVIGNKGGRGTRVPAALKMIRGTARPDRENPAEPEPPLIGNLDAPLYLSEAEAKHWNFIAPLLASVRVLTEADRTALGRYCVLQTAFEVTKTKLKTDEYALDKLMKLNVQLKSLEVEYGLTPASRSRLHAQPQKKDDGEAKKERFFA